MTDTCNHPARYSTTASATRPTQKDTMTNQTVEPTEPVKLVARKDGKPGCPERVWLGGVYPARCSCGIDECHRHGKFDVVEGDQW